MNNWTIKVWSSFTATRYSRRNHSSTYWSSIQSCALPTPTIICGWRYGGAVRAVYASTAVLWTGADALRWYSALLTGLIFHRPCFDDRLFSSLANSKLLLIRASSIAWRNRYSFLIGYSSQLFSLLSPHWIAAVCLFYFSFEIDSIVWSQLKIYSLSCIQWIFLGFAPIQFWK